MRKMASGLVLMFAILLLATPGLAIERLKFGTSIKATPAFYLPILSAQEKGFWKDRGLELEWVPLKGGGAVGRAIVAGAIRVGFVNASSPIRGRAAGIPMVIVAGISRQEWLFWVRGGGKL